MRQTWEEIGVDLAEKDFMLIGQLDDREITTSLGKRLLMILSPFGEWIFMQPYIRIHETLNFLQSFFRLSRKHLHQIPLKGLISTGCLWRLCWRQLVLKRLVQ